MIPLSTGNPQGVEVRERACFNCSGKMVSQGVRDGLYIYHCISCKSFFEVYEPK